MREIPLEELKRIVSEAAEVSTNASNERQLAYGLEHSLETICRTLGTSWSPYTLEHYLPGRKGTKRFADVIHGAVIIEYEPPRSFRGQANATYRHACQQVEEYAQILSGIEGRPITEYILVAWDGETIDFGKKTPSSAEWTGPVPFNRSTAQRLINALQTNGRPLVSQLVLAQHVGPESQTGVRLIPELYRAIVAAESVTPATKTTLLFAEWRRLFGQVVGIGDESLNAYIQAQATAHDVDYGANTSAYLFAINTYIALLAKIVAACALHGAAEDIGDSSVPISQRISALENGTLFEQAGLINMVTGDFFSWYADDPAWERFAPLITDIVDRIADIDFDIAKKSPETTRDLFKGIYETCVPRELRHALGEFYTPDWLAEHGMNVLGWDPTDELLDPTCGSGTFILEALRRRLESSQNRAVDVDRLLDGLWGTDLNPLAVLAAKASLAVFISAYIQRDDQIRLPIFLADAINPAVADGEFFEHELQTERGVKHFRLPRRMVVSPSYYPAMALIQTWIDDGMRPDTIQAQLQALFPDIADTADEWATILETIQIVFDLHDIGWNGIWCSILADRFAAAAITDVSHICGNPPWVKWSHLPREYADFIKPRCQALGVFSQDTWVGGIESDISTVITYEVIDRYLADQGKLGFFITGTVFKNESSEGFRTFSLRDGAMQCAVLSVEDYKAIRPFDGVTNHATFLTVQKGYATTYPVTYRVWDKPASGARYFESAEDFTRWCTYQPCVAQPVPGGQKTDSRPWLVATSDAIETYRAVFKPRDEATPKIARKGVTTDRNGIFWVRILDTKTGLVTIENCHDMGRTKGIAKRQADVEPDNVFPLLRGKDVTPFHAVPSLHIVLPQRGMHGNEELPSEYPKTYAFLRRFKSELEKRSSLKRFQKGKPWWSLWSTGAYTFSPHKVVWREMGGNNFFAAYAGPITEVGMTESKIVIPDHKLYFLSAASADEAHFITGFLNAPCVRNAINAYASQLSLGTSVSDYIGIPDYDEKSVIHTEIATRAEAISMSDEPPSGDDYNYINERVLSIL